MKILISAGPTREPWDAVRFLSNRSSGKMGYALAAAAAARGAEVTLVSGPVELPDPPGVKTIRVETAGEMSKTVLETWKNVNAAVMAAAVADYRPARPHAGKFKKGKRVPSISLARTQDILAEMGNEKIGRILVGFAAESERVKENAKAKLKAKRLDLIVANPIAGKDDAMGADMSRAYLIDASGGEEELPRLPKAEVAERVLDRIAALWRKSKAPKSAGRYIGRRRPQKRASQKKRHVPKPPAR
ncbi:MAG: phosphopantothenoylcysteine decarboxylase [Nitrospinota bacterium]